MNSAVRTVADIPGRGQGLVAVRTIKPGEVLLTDSPLFLYPALDPSPSSSSSYSSSWCAHCYRTLPAEAAAVGCAGCSGQARFCGEQCGARALVSSHTGWVCQALARIRSLPPQDNPEAATQAAFLVAAYNLAAVSPAAFHRLLSLHGGAADHPSPELPLALHALLCSLFPPPGPAGFGPELTAALLAKDRMNAFGLMEPCSGGLRRVRAYGIYPSAALFNHDCLPNVCRFDYIDSPGFGANTDLVVRAIHEIQPGRELCLSYFPVNWSFRERQRRLLNDYGFVCACDRCVVESNWAEDKEEEEEQPESMDEEEEEEEDDDDDEQVMEEEDDDDDGGGGGGDFPHAYFFARFMCQKEDCGGTLAPLPPSPNGQLSDTSECNACGTFAKVGDDGIAAEG
ncbi:ASH1-related protein 2 [Wolffia australiana]